MNVEYYYLLAISGLAFCWILRQPEAVCRIERPLSHAVLSLRGCHMRFQRGRCFHITLCYRALPSSRFPSIRADHLSASHTESESDKEERGEVYQSNKITNPSKLLRVMRMRFVPALVPEEYTLELQYCSPTVPCPAASYLRKET